MDLYLSDLHLGNPLFKSEGEVKSLINDKRFDRIFLVGDIIDTWEDQFSNIELKYKLLITAINDVIEKEGKQVVVIKGNHDPETPVLKYIFPEAIVLDTFTEDDVIVIHGQQFDQAILKFGIFNKLFYYTVVYPVNRFFNYNIRDTFRLMYTSVAYRREKSHYNELVFQIERDAVKAHQEKFNYVIMGHTHFPKINDNDEQCTYINCGDWIHNKTYVIRDNDRKFHLEGNICGTY